MSGKTIIRLILFNLSLSLVNICVFSPALFGIRLIGADAETFETAVGVTVIGMSALLFFYVNYKLLQKAPPEPEPSFDRNPKSLDDCAEGIRNYIAKGAKTFKTELESILTQINRMKKREVTIEDLIADKFSPTEMSYAKFHGTVDGVKRIMLLNVRNALNRIVAFEEDEYAAAISGADGDSGIARSKKDLFNEYASLMRKSVDNNEEILIRVDKLILEISKLDEIHGGAVEDMDAIREIDALIGDAKWYK